MVLNDFKSPFNIVSLFLGLTGIVIGIYFYYDGKQYKKISFQIDEEASKIYDSKNTSSIIRVIEKDSVLISENVYYVRGKVWNSGNLPILFSDIRKPLVIKLNPCKRILDYKIEKQYEDTTQGFKLIKIDQNKLEVNWKFFDPKNGFSFQIIYLGSENPNAILEGKVLGISTFESVNQNKKPLHG